MAVGKFVAIGLNYADHAREANLPLLSEPIVFQKAITSVSGLNDRLVLPKDSKKSGWEVELGIVVGSPGDIVVQNGTRHRSRACRSSRVRACRWPRTRNDRVRLGVAADAEITRRSITFMERQSQAKKPFFAYATLT